LIDTKKRSIIKAVSWRLVAVLVLSVVTLALTRDIKTASIITLIYHGFQAFFYFIHERLWNSFSWGRSSGLLIQMTGMSGAGKSTLANAAAERLRKRGIPTEIIDGDEYRAGLCSDLGFSKEDRNTNIRRLGFVGKVLARNNVVSIIAAINPYDSIRQELSKIHNNSTLVFVNCDLEELKDRDTKGLYHKALLPDDHPDKIYNFTGISDPFEAPSDADLIINTQHESVDRSAKKLEKFVLDNISK